MSTVAICSKDSIITSNQEDWAKKLFTTMFVWETTIIRAITIWREVDGLTAISRILNLGFKLLRGTGPTKGRITPMIGSIEILGTMR